jgi:heat shock protein HslJ
MKRITILVGILGFLVACSNSLATTTVMPTPILSTPMIVSTPAPSITTQPAEPIVTTQPVTIAPYEDIDWQLTELNGEPITQTPPPTIKFTNMMSISGAGFCNSYSGNYSGGMSSILIGNIASTQKACADQSLMSLESAYFDTIITVMYLTATNDTLTLFSANETPVAIFTKK